jgi:3-oxoisoapionate kinase
VLLSGRGVVLTSDDIDTAAAGERPVLEVIAEAAASVVSTVARDGASQRVIVCGGDTSSRVTRLLGVESLSIAANPSGNVVLLRAQSGDAAIDGIELLLKGGQVGSDTLFTDIADLGDDPAR